MPVCCRRQLYMYQIITEQKQCISLFWFFFFRSRVKISIKKMKLSSTVQNMLQHLQANKYVAFLLNLAWYVCSSFCVLRPKAEYEAPLSKTRQYNPQYGSILTLVGLPVSIKWHYTTCLISCFHKWTAVTPSSLCLSWHKQNRNAIYFKHTFMMENICTI